MPAEHPATASQAYGGPSFAYGFTAGEAVIAPDVASGIQVAATATTDMVYSIQIANNKTVRFSYGDIPDPVNLTFANNVERLDRVWDDTTSSWNAEECGKISNINGTTIALRYWIDVYRNKKDKRWKGIKALWTEWKYVAERYRLGTPDQFWSEFSTEGGQRLSWTGICTRLREQRATRDHQLANRARDEYGANFAVAFSNRGKVMMDVSAIARRYLQLKETIIA